MIRFLCAAAEPFGTVGLGGAASVGAGRARAVTARASADGGKIMGDG